MDRLLHRINGRLLCGGFGVRSGLWRFETLSLSTLQPRSTSCALQRRSSFASSSATASKDNDGIATIEDFAKLDIRVVKIVEASSVEGANKLIKLKVDLGEAFQKSDEADPNARYRTVFSGIKAYYDATTLIGRKVLYLANLKPRKMKFGVSEGMILAASSVANEKGTSSSGVFLASVDEGAEAGMKVT